MYIIDITFMYIGKTNTNTNKWLERGTHLGGITSRVDSQRATQSKTMEGVYRFIAIYIHMILIHHAYFAM